MLLTFQQNRLLFSTTLQIKDCNKYTLCAKKVNQKKYTIFLALRCPKEKGNRREINKEW